MRKLRKIRINNIGPALRKIMAFYRRMVRSTRIRLRKA